MTYSRKRFLFGAPLLAALVVALVGWASHRAVRRTIEAKLRGELQTVLNANTTALEIWVHTQTRLASVLGGDPQVRELTATLTRQAGEQEPLNRRALSALPAQAELQRVLDARIQPAGYGAALVLATNLQIVGTSSRARSRLGEIIENEHAARVLEALTNGRPVLITPFKAGFGRPRGGRGGFAAGRGPGPAADAFVGPPPPPPRDRDRPPGTNGFPRPAGPDGRSGPPVRPDLNLMEVIAPVLDDSGRVIAAVAFVLRPEEEFTRVLSVARPGESGETFAFDLGGRLISGSRFDEQLKQLGLLTNAPGVSSSLNVELRDPGVDLTRGFTPRTNNAAARPLTAMVAEAVAGESGLTVTPVRDYRGVPVVGAWCWVADHNFGVVTKIDAAEAFQPLRVLRLIVFALLLLLAVTTLVMLVTGYGSAVWKRRFNEARLKARQLGQYTLLEKIGEGAMGVVYRASHALLRRETAVKLLLPDRADAELIRQFEHEVQLTCRLSHPNTIQIYDYGRTHDGIFYYAMELLRGITLLQLVERHGPQPEERVIHLLTQVCESLREAHAAGLIHRDIKPGNLFLCERGGVPDTVKVLDFGLVRRFRDETSGALPTDSGGARFLGTPLYMAPETIRHPGFGDPRSDIYAVGAVGYVLLTAQPVFDGETPEEIWRHQESSAPQPPSQRTRRSVSPALEALMLRCLAKDPADRPQSMDELLSALRACPKAGAWTAEHRAAWWAAHGVPENREPGTPVTRPATDATLKIDFNHRAD